MNKLIVAAAILVVFTGSSRASESAQKETISYSAARHILLERGFQPYTMPGAGECSEDGHRCYPELVNCTSKRRWSCDYTWKLNGVIYQVETSAETPMVDSFYCIVNCANVKKQTLALDE